MSVAITASPTELPPYFTSSTAHDLGITRWQLAEMVRHGVVRRPLRDVYVDAAVPDSIDTRLRAVSLVMPEHCVLVDRTAAWVWGVDVLQHWELEHLPRLEVYALRGHKPMTRPGAGGGTRDLAERDLVRVRDCLVTTPLRTALDLCCRLPRYAALAAADALAREHDLDVARMSRELVRFRRRRGVVQARALVPLVDARAESPGESFTRLIVIESGLPAPVPQHWVDVDGVPRYRLDLAYPLLKICVEYDGEEFHTGSQRREADERRRAWLRAEGWHVIVVTKASLRGEERDAWVTELRRVYAERTAWRMPRG